MILVVLLTGHHDGDDDESEERPLECYLPETPGPSQESKNKKVWKAGERGVDKQSVSGAILHVMG